MEKIIEITKYIEMGFRRNTNTITDNFNTKKQFLLTVIDRLER
jgi:hypothetical protein